MQPNPPPVVQPLGADYYQIVSLLGELKGRIDAFIAAQERHEQQQDKLAERIGTLEKSHAKLLGQAGVIATVASGILTIILKFLGVS